MQIQLQLGSHSTVQLFHFINIWRQKHIHEWSLKLSTSFQKMDVKFSDDSKIVGWRRQMEVLATKCTFIWKALIDLEARPTLLTFHHCLQFECSIDQSKILRTETPLASFVPNYFVEPGRKIHSRRSSIIWKFLPIFKAFLHICIHASRIIMSVRPSVHASLCRFVRLFICPFYTTTKPNWTKLEKVFPSTRDPWSLNCSPKYPLPTH